MNIEFPRGRKRSHQQIVASILEACVRPQLKTRIMYQSNLSWGPLTKELAILQERGLIEKVGKRYQLTEKGIQVLRTLRAALEWTRRGSR